ncbi:MAG: prolipoprotein diacylglyceryl transferase, partial [Lentisphaerae bacterium]|nr:prolipoprotein diacylglyceryl transferase [Lentisphaerota bacterium]
MNPVCFHLLGRPIYWYGVMFALAFLAGVLNWHLILRKEGRRTDLAADLAFWLMLSGIIGARLAYVFANLHSYFPENPTSVFRIDEGGLVFYGGLITAGITVFFMARRYKQPLLKFLDFVITALPLGHALGRVGCFINGCCYGSKTNVPWAVVLDGVHRHPVQLYEAGINLLIYVALLVLYFKRKKDGLVLACYLIVYSVTRFILEFVRGDERLCWLGLDFAQWVSVG